MIDLKPFCHDDPEILPPDLAALTAPFSLGDCTYASNGKVIVRVARRADVAELAAGHHLRNAPDLFEVRKRRILAPFGGMDLPAAVPDDWAISIDLRGGIFALEYVRPIAGLPDLKLEIVAPDVSLSISLIDPALALKFFFGGEDPGEGLLMPRRAAAERHLELEERGA
jgi:hypothetical protein